MGHETSLRVRDDFSDRREAPPMPHAPCLMPFHVLNTRAGSMDATLRNEIIAAPRQSTIEPMKTAIESGIGITSFRSIFWMTGRNAYDIRAPSAKPAMAAMVACLA